MSNAYVLVAPTSGFVFTNALTQDVVFFSQSNTQKVLMGVNSNSQAAITCSCNLTQIDLDTLFTSNNINRMIVSSNTGIGTITPRTPLHIQSNVPGGNASLLTLQNIGGGNNTALTSIDFLTWNSVNTQARLSVVDSNFSGAFVFFTKTAGVDTNPLVERMRLRPDGDLILYNTFKTSNASAVSTMAPTGFSGDGSAITNINAGNIASGTLAVARGGTGSTTSTGTAGSSVVLATSPTISAPTFTGTATAATINATSITVGGILSESASGYVKIMGNLMFQWGKVNVSHSANFYGSSSVTFSRAFSAAPYTISLTKQANGNQYGNSSDVIANNISTTGFTIESYSANTNLTFTWPVMYLAIGLA